MNIDTINWECLLEFEPRLGSMVDTINYLRRREIDPDKTSYPSFCAQQVWHWDLKPRLIHLVGWGRRSQHEVLSTEEAYEIAYDHLWRALPECRNCACTFEVD